MKNVHSSRFRIIMIPMLVLLSWSCKKAELDPNDSVPEKALSQSVQMIGKIDPSGQAVPLVSEQELVSIAQSSQLSGSRGVVSSARIYSSGETWYVQGFGINQTTGEEFTVYVELTLFSNGELGLQAEREEHRCSEVAASCQLEFCELKDAANGFKRCSCSGGVNGFCNHTVIYIEDNK